MDVTRRYVRNPSKHSLDALRLTLMPKKHWRLGLAVTLNGSEQEEKAGGTARTSQGRRIPAIHDGDDPAVHAVPWIFL
jgi:hypothetical protein